MLILKIVGLGPTHGYAISQRIQQISNDVFQLTQGSLYPALHRLEDQGWLAAEWKETDIYVIAGATHPHVRAREGDRYRHQLEALARELGVHREVIFHNRFFSPQEMAELVESADIYITPYCRVAQAVSGTLAYAMGAGKAIISTPYWHAAELLDDGRGTLVPFEDPAAIAAAAIELLDNDAKRHAMRKRAYLYAREMVWNRVAQSYIRSFSRAQSRRTQPAHLGFPTQPAEKIAASLLSSV